MRLNKQKSTSPHTTGLTDRERALRNLPIRARGSCHKQWGLGKFIIIYFGAEKCSYLSSNIFVTHVSRAAPSYFSKTRTVFVRSISHPPDATGRSSVSPQGNRPIVVVKRRHTAATSCTFSPRPTELIVSLNRSVRACDGVECFPSFYFSSPSQVRLGADCFLCTHLFPPPIEHPRPQRALRAPL